MSLGHGQLGLQDRLRTFLKDLILDPEADLRPFLEQHLGLSLTGWAASGSNWTRTVTAAELTFAGVIRPIVGAESLIHPRPLVRVERTADLVAGTWHYDDSALVAGGSTTLTVRLPTATDPDAETAGLVVHLLFASSTVGEVHPTMGPEKLPDPGIEEWGGGNPTQYTEVGAGAVQETTIVYSGSSSAKIGSAAVGSGAFDGLEEDAALLVQNGIYRFSVYYQTPLAGQSADIEARLRIGRAGAYMLSDGRNTTAASEGFRVADTQGEWRHVCFDFVWTEATSTAIHAGLFLKNTAGAARAGLLYVDYISFKRIHRYTYFAPALDGGSIPELEIRAQSINFGPTTIGIGSATLLDGDGSLAVAFSQLLLLQKDALISVGGVFPNGAEIPSSDWWPAFAGVTRRPTFTDGRIEIELDTAHRMTRVDVPPATHRVAAAATMARTDEGVPKPLVFGTPWDTGGATFQHIIPAVRVALNATTAYGEYEYLDPMVPVRDAVDVDLPASYSIKVFPNKDLADRNLQGYVINDSTNDFNVTNNKTRWRVLRDIRNYRYDKSGNDVGTNASFPFGVAGPGAPILFADLDISGPAYKVAADLQAAMRTAIGGGDTTTTVVYSETTHKFTVARSSGTLDIFVTSKLQERAHVQSWGILGFDSRTDKTGLTTYTGDEATFTDSEVDHVIRFPGGGYRDDATGSICGTANVAISTPAAIAAWLLRHVLNVPAVRIDVPSFAAARALQLSVDFSIQFRFIARDAAETVLGELCQVGLFDLRTDGLGRWTCKRYVTSTAGAREFFDRDYLSWRMWLDPSAVYREVRIHGDFNPSLVRYMTYADASVVLDPFIPIKHGEERVLEINGAIERQYIVGGTQLVSGYYGRLVGKIPRVVEFSCRGKLIDLLVGDKVLLTRSRAFDPSGTLTADPYRVIGLRHNFLTGVSVCAAVEDVVFLT